MPLILSLFHPNKGIMKTMIFGIAGILLTQLLAAQSAEPDSVTSRESYIDLYLDGDLVDMDYFREQLTAVNYVYDRTVADVYLLATSTATGSGGKQYSLLYKGQGRYSGMNDTIVYYLPPNATDEESRSCMLRHAELGLVPFLMKTPVKNHMILMLDEEASKASGDDYTDKWRNWRISLGAGGDISSQKSYRQYGFAGNLYLGKVSDQIKFESSNGFVFSESQYKLYEGDSIVYSSFNSQRSFSSNNLFVKSIGNHFGAGGIASYERSDFFNLKNQFNIGPAIEFNAFDYREYSRKALRFIYFLDFSYTDYHESTILDRLHERRYSQTLLARYKEINDWGSAYVSFSAGNYLHNWSLFAVDASASASVSLGKSLFLHMSAGCSYVNNQIGLKKETMSPEEFLLREYEVETDFNYFFSVGFIIELGSKKNNIVNPRFDW